MGLNGKLKRKEMDQFNDDFSDFSLSSPATKIRRLDAELPPIIEEEEPFPEKAMVLFNPAVHPGHLHRSPSTLSLHLNSDLITGFKNQFLRATQMKSGESEQRNWAKEGCLAVIPWVPCQIPSVESRDGTESLMEDEMDIEESNNNCNNEQREQEQEFGYGLDLEPSEALVQQHWPQPAPPPQQQQHCMIPQPPQNPFSWPLTWSR